MTTLSSEALLIKPQTPKKTLVFEGKKKKGRKFIHFFIRLFPIKLWGALELFLVVTMQEPKIHLNQVIPVHGSRHTPLTQTHIAKGNLM